MTEIIRLIPFNIYNVRCLSNKGKKILIYLSRHTRYTVNHLNKLKINEYAVQCLKKKLGNRFMIIDCMIYTNALKLNLSYILRSPMILSDNFTPKALVVTIPMTTHVWYS